MATQLTQEQVEITTRTLRDGSRLLSSNSTSGTTTRTWTDGTSIQSYHEYELNQSESLTFLYNLLYDEDSQLSKADILGVLNSLKYREDNLPFAIEDLNKTDSQGVKWSPELRRKFYMDRIRMGANNWFHNVPNSREKALNSVSITNFKTTTEFFRFHKFYSKLKLHITHFQLRNLVCCGSNISNGIYYHLSYFHDHNLQTVHNNTIINNNSTGLSDEDYYNFFKINRFMPNDNLPQESEAMKLECLIDSRTLLKNSNYRISTLACTNNYLACGTFEGGYLLSDVADPNDSKLLGEFHITRNGDGISNHIIINEAQKALLISSNDRTFRSIDMATNSTLHLIELPFAINCAAINKQNVNEVFIAGDHVNAFIIDKRNQDFKSSIAFQGHQDFGFSCDWSTTNENLLVTGNQDSCVRLWDKRKPSSSLYSWSGALGSRSSINTGAPIRNCKFSYNSEFVSWAESLDHVGLIKLEDLQPDSTLQTWAQSIDFIGKCTGLNFAPIENGYGEQLVIGVNDCPLGGILSYKLESKSKSLDFDFQF